MEWSGLNVELDLPCPSIFPLPGLFEQRVQIRTGSQALMEATHFLGALYL